MTPTTGDRRQWVAGLQWTLAALSAIVAALLLSWQLLASVNFLYPLWYEVIDIGATITEYGPQNRYRHNFEQTDKAERVRLFAAIVAAINGGGTDPDTLYYHDRQGRTLDRLLTPPEVQHLRDVAVLVGYFKLAGWIAGVICLLQLWLLHHRRVHAPPGARFLAWGAGGLALLGLMLWLGGAEALFYRLHVWLFPAGHQWYFYYQDSLMTMMMQAPVLFAWIAVEWLAGALLLLLALFPVARRTGLIL
jgi:hypothetical protein